jgi:TolA-binding protein
MTCRERFPGTADAAQAAFLLGRSAAPAVAARWFDEYLREAPGGPFAREAAGRLVESHSRAGNHAAARQAASVYLQRYPNGPHAAFARSIIVASSDDE